MLVTRTASPLITQGLTSPHPLLDLSVSMRSPPSSLSSSQDEPQLSPSPPREKRRKPVPASGRGGLGNIRARKEAKGHATSPTPKSPSKAKHSISATLSPFRRTFTSSSSSTQSTISSGASIRSDVDSIAATFGSGFASMASGSSDGDADCVARAGGPLIHTSPRPDYMSELGSPLSPMLAPSTTSSVSGIGKSTNGSGFKSKAAVSVATDYVENLHADARQRALEKRMVRERAKEARILAGGIDGTAGNTIGVECAETESIEGKVVTIRSGRGGAGKLKSIGGGIDPTLHPRAADIAREYEERAAAQERSIVAASRLRSTINGSTGRGGSGNVGIVGKSSSKKKSKKDEKGKGRADIADDDHGVDESQLTLEELDAREARDKEDDATLALDMKKEKKGLRKLWKRVVRSQSESMNVLASSSSASIEEGRTPRQSMGDSIMQIGRPSSPSPSAPVASSAHLQRYASASTLASTSQAQEPTRLRKGIRSREELKEGAALLAFVNAALPDLPGARNILGVPGTPGFPFPGLGTVETAASSRSSTPATAMPPASSNVNSYSLREKIESPGRSTLSRTASTIGQDWVDDDTLHDADGPGVPKEDDEDEDSDIDPQLFLSIPKQQQQYSLPPLSDSNRPDSLDFVIRVALDKLDRAELTDREDDIAEEDEDALIDAYTVLGTDSAHSRFAHPVQPLSFRSGNHYPRPAATRPPPSSYVFPSTPRYMRAPTLPAGFKSGDKVQAARLSSPEKQTMHIGPPVRPIPQVPEDH